MSAPKGTKDLKRRKQAQFLKRVSTGTSQKAAMEDLGYTRMALEHWKKDPEFRERLQMALRLATGGGSPEPGPFIAFRGEFLNVPSFNPYTGKTAHVGQTFDFMRPVCEAMDDPEVQRLGIILPVRHTKTTLAEQFVVKEFCKNPNLRVIYITSNINHGRERAYNIQRMLLDDSAYPDLHAKWGPWIAKPEDSAKPWTKTSFYIRGRNSPERSPSFSAYGITAKVYGARADLIILDDVDDPDNGPEERASIVRAINGPILSRLTEGGKIIYIGCLTGDSRVLLEDGTWRNINEIKPGEFVVSWDGEGFSPREVEAMLPQGEAEIVEVRTKKRSIRATATHPFLLEDGTWRRAGDLQRGDVIRSITEWEGVDEGWMSSDVMWLLGFILGDGWVKERATSGCLCIATSAYPELNERVLDLCEDVFGKRPFSTPFGYVRLDSLFIVRALKELGFGGGAKTKRIPEWVFRCSIGAKRAFLKGLLDADGSVQKGYWRIELANEGLIRDIQALAWTSRITPARIGFRSRRSQPPHSPEPIQALAWNVGLNLNNRRTKTDSVVEVVPAGREEVYDLTVEGMHNFVAEGFVVHNTRVGVNDVPESLMKIPGWRWIVQTAIQEDGSALCPELYDLPELDVMREQMGEELFQMMLMNNPAPEGSMVFPPQLLDNAKGPFDTAPEDWERWTGLDPATSGRAAIVTVAHNPQTREVRVIDVEARTNPRHDGLLQMLRIQLARHRPRFVVIEAQGGSHLFTDTPEAKDLIYDEGARLITFQTTGANKHDAQFGIPLLAREMERERLRIANGPASVQTMKPLLDDLLSWQPNPGKRHRYDTVMALWFVVHSIVRNVRPRGQKWGQDPLAKMTSGKWLFGRRRVS